MSRDYQEYCPSCKKYNARRMYILDDVELIQCLEKDCGNCYAEIHTYKKLDTTGIDEKAWKKATKEILKSEDKTEP